MVIVGFHLWHGASSAFQTVGIDTPRTTPVIRRLGQAAAIILAGGFLSIPIWVYFFGGRS